MCNRPSAGPDAGGRPQWTLPAHCDPKNRDICVAFASNFLGRKQEPLAGHSCYFIGLLPEPVPFYVPPDRTIIIPSCRGSPLLERCSQTGVLAPLGCGRQRIWCAADESEYPGDVVDTNLSLRPLKVQPRLRGTNEPLGLSITHHPATPLPLPTRTRAYLAAKVHEQRVPGKSNGRHCSLSAVGTRIVPPRGIAVQGQNLGRRTISRNRREVRDGGLYPRSSCTR